MKSFLSTTRVRLLIIFYTGLPVFGASYAQAQSVRVGVVPTTTIISQNPKVILKNDLKVYETLAEQKHLFPSQSYVERTLSQIAKIKISMGTKDGGGGSVLSLANGEKILLDLYVHDSLRVETFGPQKGSVIPETRSYNNLGVGYLEPSSSIFQKALQIAQKWKLSSPKIASLLEQSLKNTPFFFTKHTMHFQDSHYFIPSELVDIIDTNSIATAAFYVDYFGVLLSKPLFDSLDMQSQTALIVHEALRRVQIGYGYFFSDKELQEITSILVLSSASPSTLLDKYLERFSVDVSLEDLSRLTYAAQERAEKSMSGSLSAQERESLRQEARVLNEAAAALQQILTAHNFQPNAAIAQAVDTLSLWNVSVLIEELKNPSDRQVQENLVKVLNNLLAAGILR